MITILKSRLHLSAISTISLTAKVLTAQPLCEFVRARSGWHDTGSQMRLNQIRMGRPPNGFAWGTGILGILGSAGWLLARADAVLACPFGDIQSFVGPLDHLARTRSPSRLGYADADRHSEVSKTAVL